MKGENLAKARELGPFFSSFSHFAGLFESQINLFLYVYGLLLILFLFLNKMGANGEVVL
jgi:hypothetical protein